MSRRAPSTPPSPTSKYTSQDRCCCWYILLSFLAIILYTIFLDRSFKDAFLQNISNSVIRWFVVVLI